MPLNLQPTVRCRLLTAGDLGATGPHPGATRYAKVQHALTGL
jgi:hypothetical protein